MTSSGLNHRSISRLALSTESLPWHIFLKYRIFYFNTCNCWHTNIWKNEICHVIELSSEKMRLQTKSFLKTILSYSCFINTQQFLLNILVIIWKMSKFCCTNKYFPDLIKFPQKLQSFHSWTCTSFDEIASYVPQLTKFNHLKSTDCTENISASMTTLDQFHDGRNQHN